MHSDVPQGCPGLRTLPEWPAVGEKESGERDKPNGGYGCAWWSVKLWRTVLLEDFAEQVYWARERL